MDLKLDVAREFTTAPGARLRSEGEHSAEEFRYRLLAPRLRTVLSEWGTLTVNLDGTAGYAASFLEEAFGGLIREEGFTQTELKLGLKFVSEEDRSILDEIEDAITDAQVELVKRCNAQKSVCICGCHRSEFTD